MANKNGKPTNKERDRAIGELYARTNQQNEQLRQLDVIVGLYIDMKGDKKEFNEHIVEMQKKMREEDEKNDSKENGETDKPNLQGDTDGESSGSKGVRKKRK